VADRFDDAFRPAEDTVSWAEEAIAEFDASARAFFKENIRSVTEFDSETGENVAKVKFRNEMPDTLRRKATEALTNSRHCFDQSAFAAVNIVTGAKPGSVHYPWSESPKDLKGKLERSFDQRLWNEFGSHEPYPCGQGYSGGDDLIRALAKLANRKHDVGLAAHAFAMSSTTPVRGKHIQRLRMLNPVWDPVKNEMELVRWIGQVEFHDEAKFDFQIALQDTGLSHPVWTNAALEIFANKAKVVTESLKSCCRALLGS
jgi:hypothetical protein